MRARLSRHTRCRYPRLISVDSFRTPNFELVADILYWLVHRYDPELHIEDGIGTENERVRFLKSVAEAMAVKARIKLNLKKLYGADGYAVKEMLKIASVLDQALRDARRSQAGAPTVNPTDGVPSMSSKMGDLKMCRTLAAEITARAAKLSDLLKFEEQAREERTRVVNRNVELDEVERDVRNTVRTLTESVATVTRSIKDIASDEANLEVSPLPNHHRSVAAV